MPGLSVKISKKDKIFNGKQILKNFQKINRIPSINYNENYILGENYVFYSCVPDFIKDKKIAKIDNFIIIYDGDFFNENELVKQLNTYYSGKAELIFKLYQRYGNSFAKFLNGDFVVVIYNIESKELLLTNDRFARRPFFYFDEKYTIIMGSEKKNILCCLDNIQMDYLGLLQVFSHSHNIMGRTFIKNIHSLSPATILRINVHRRTISHYYTWYFDSNYDINRKVMIEEMHQAIINAVNLRLKDKDRILLLLSGGHDSRGIALAIKEKKRLFTQVYTFGEEDSYEIKIAKKLSSILGYKFKHKKIEISPSLQATIGTWKSEFAVNASGHSYMSSHKELKNDGDYILSGLPGLDTLNGAYMSPRIVLSSLIPFCYPQLVFGMYAKSFNALLDIFNYNFLKNYYPKLKQEFISSIKNIKAANKKDQYDIWFTVERQSQFSHMADLVERDLFEYIAPYTDIKLLEIFTRIPTLERIYQQYSKDLLFRFYPDVRHIPYDNGRGLIIEKNSFWTYIREYIVKKYNLKHFPRTIFWNYSLALNKNLEVKSMIIDTISNSEELKTIFNINKIRKLLTDHYKGIKDNANIIGLLLSFSNAYKFLINFESMKIPDEIINYYDGFN